MAFLRKVFQKPPHKIHQGWPHSPRAYRLSSGLHAHQLAPAPASPLNLRVLAKLLPSILSQETPG